MENGEWLFHSPFSFQLSAMVMDLRQELERQKSLLRNYEELLVDQEDDSAYVARGNGFCDSKYSEDFLDGQIAVIKQRIAELESQIEKQQN